ncbi:MAG: M3 family oligoendopeptidase [Anaerolineales bacterium]|jgi:oligoendopeptidase F
MPPNYQQKRWSLADLYPSEQSAEMEASLSELEARVSRFETFRDRLEPTIRLETFLEILAELEEITRLAHRLGGFVELRYSEDTQDQTILAFKGRLDNRMAEINNRTLFFSLWWKGLPVSAAERLQAGAGDATYHLEQMRKLRPHTLSEPEEKVINLKDVTGTEALRTLYSTLTNRYVFRLEVEGQVRELTRGELMVFVRSPDPGLRAAAYQSQYKVYAEDGAILGLIYSALVRDWRNENLGLRKFRSPQAVRNLANDLPDPVVETLLEVCRRNAPLFQRFFALKARWLKMPRLRRYDLYAPVASAEKRYEFAAGIRQVMESLDSFEPRLADLAERVLEADHLDSEVRPGKRGGAFCAPVEPKLVPWVQANYQGRAEDVATLAHELGHAIHSELASGHSLFTFHSSLPLAETASTFAEMLLVDRLLAQEKDEAVRRDLLFRQIDDAYATIGRQAYFSLFEKEAHELIPQGASVEELSRRYLENLRDQFGDSLDLAPEFRWEWVSIPHIYEVPFYVYAYAFGQLLVFSLYRRYQAQGKSFIPEYLEILSAGGSASPDRILSKAGIHIQEAAFWQSGFDAIRDRIVQLEDLPLPPAR